MEYNVWADATHYTVAHTAVHWWRNRARERVVNLLAVRAPDAILWHQMSRFAPGRMPTMSRPQYALVETIKNDPVLETKVLKHSIRMTTPRGVVTFMIGRWGPWWKVEW
jgi:hypothetical protein